MMAREAWYEERCMTKSRNKFPKFSNDEENHVKKDVEKNLEAIAIAECISFIKDSLQSSTEVAPFTNWFWGQTSQ